MTIPQMYMMTTEESTGVLHFNDEADLNRYLTGKRSR